MVIEQSNVPSAMTRDDALHIERFLDALWMERGLSQNSLDSYRRDLEKFQRWLQWRSLPLIAVTAVELLEYLAQLQSDGISSKSVARLLSCLRGFYRHALREQWIAVDPTINIAMPKLGRALPKPISEQDV